ncbi:hypothetical protein PIB30_087917 [Stylosanthes scabra]|uniref:Uncharacterized protein n=1 Tax=Stylosanthes scabra TaxID=79078 RepID=A0ABU6ZS63_9FABA|nr:hypothetical protein [Stylosanthes scabra]
MGYSLNLHPARLANKPAPRPILPAPVPKLFSAVAAVLGRSRRRRGMESVVPPFPCTIVRKTSRVVLFCRRGCPLVLVDGVLF